MHIVNRNSRKLEGHEDNLESEVKIESEDFGKIEEDSKENLHRSSDENSIIQEETMSGGSISIEKLNKENYDTWKLHMEAILIKNDLWEYVDGTCNKPQAAAEIPTWEKKDNKARADIILAVSSSELCHIKRCKTSREVWKTLEEVYRSKGPARKAILLKQLLFNKMSDDGSMQEHLNNFFNCVDKLKEIEIQVADDILSILLLYSIPSAYENFRCAIESRDSLPTPEVLKVKLLEEATSRQNSIVSQSEQEALQIQHGNNKWNGKKNQRIMESQKHGPGKPDKNKGKWNKINDKEIKLNKSKGIECFYCHKLGHRAAQCLKKKNDIQKAQLTHHEEANSDAEALVVYTDNQEEILTTNFNFNTNFESSDRWCLDSGATSHMCCDKNSFVSLNPVQKQVVKLANNESADIKGKGTVIINTLINDKINKIRLEDTLYVPDLKTNLISVSKCTAREKKIIFNHKSATILGKNDKPIIRAKREGNLYFVDIKTDIANIVTQCTNSMKDWHERYGHLNEADLKLLATRELVDGLQKMKIKKMSTCEVCLKGKQTATPIPKKTKLRETNLLELIHSDLCGPIRTNSIGGAKYFATFIDDKSRWVQVYFLKSKDEVKNAFLKFKALVENQKGVKIKTLRTDNGLEYLGKDFTEELERCGIRREFTTPHTPQQNGLAERMNRTLLEMARCMIIQSKLSHQFWAEAVNTASYIRNRCPTVHGRTPYEIWYQKKPKVDHFKVFGSDVYVLNKQPGKDKFEPRSLKCYFLGYSNESKGYRLWNIKKGKVIISRDVSFVKTFENDDTKSTSEFEYNLDNKESESNDNINIFTENIEDLSDYQTEDKCDEDASTSEEDASTNEKDETNENDTDDFSTNAKMEKQAIREKLTLKRGKGRPAILRTGKKGRPKKSYNIIQINKDYVQLAEDDQCESTDDALSGPYANEWKLSMKQEYDALVKQEVWELVPRPDNKKIIGSRWVLKTKYNEDGSVERRKARLVAKGCAQRPGIEFNETFAPVARFTSIRVMMAISAIKGLDLYQLDITMAYTYGELNEEIYMEQAEHFKIPDKPNHVYRLRKSIYGLKQSGRQWFKKLDHHLKEIGLQHLEADHCVYFLQKGGKILIMTVYVDDLIIATNENELLNQIKNKLKETFKMRDLGPLKYCLGIQFVQDKESKEIKMNQFKYISDLVKRYKLQEANIAITPLEPKIKLSKNEDSPEISSKQYQSLIGSLMYAAIATRPDIMYAVSALSCFNNCPRRSQWTSAKRVLRYLKGTANLSLCFRSTSKPLTGFVDADWGGDVDTRTSRTGYIFKLAGAAVSWESRKQRSVATSSTEAEYMALTEASREAVYLRRLLNELKLIQLNQPTTIFCDNQSASKLVRNHIFHARTKHIDIRHHYVRQVFEEGSIDITYLKTSEMTADLLTKSLSKPSLTKHRIKMGLKDSQIPVEGVC